MADRHHHFSLRSVYTTTAAAAAATTATIDAIAVIIGATESDVDDYEGT